MPQLILVNEKDEIIGFADKDRCHQGKGLLHRAFSVYIFNEEGKLLLQQRSKVKKLWPLYWSNSCCSHPLPGESYQKAGERRLQEELGFSTSLKLKDKFHYQAQYQDVGSENELCAVLVGRYQGKIKAHPQEVAAWKWISLPELKKDIIKNPNHYTPWLIIGLPRVEKCFCRGISEFE